MTEKWIIRGILVLLILLLAVMTWGVLIAVQSRYDPIPILEVSDCQDLNNLVMSTIHENIEISNKLKALRAVHNQFKMETVRAVLVLSVIEKKPRGLTRQEKQLVMDNMKKLNKLLLRDAPKVEVQGHNP